MDCGTSNGPLQEPNSYGSSASKDRSYDYTTNQLVFLTQVVNKLFRIRLSEHFRDPVDPIVLNIPDYPDIIKNPMDLGTIRERLLSHRYRNGTECVNDVKLMFHNCYVYNPPNHTIYLLAQELEEEFMAQVSVLKFPRVELNIPLPSGARKGSKPISSFNPSQIRGRLPGPAPRKRLQSAPKRSPPKTTPLLTAAMTKTSPGPSVPILTYPTARTTDLPVFGQKSAVLPPARPEGKISLMHVVDFRQVVPFVGPARVEPPPRMIVRPLLYAGPDSKKKAVGVPNLKVLSVMPEQLRRCQGILHEMFGPRHSAYAFPFYVKVDATAPDLRDYYTIIKRPMDMTTIKTKLDQQQYLNVLEFASDVRLMFTNAYRYNPPLHEIAVMAKKLQIVFELWFAKLPDEAFADIQRPVVVSRTAETDWLNVAGVQPLKNRLAELKQRLQLVTETVGTLAMEKSINQPKSCTSRMVAKPAPVTGSGRKGRPTGPRKKKKKSERLAASPVRPGSRAGAASETPEKKKSFSGEKLDQCNGKAIKSGALEDVRPLSSDESYRLSMNLIRLSPDQLNQAVNIIRSDSSMRQLTGEEVEINMDTLSATTLRQLDTYVNSVLGISPAEKVVAMSSGAKQKSNHNQPVPDREEMDVDEITHDATSDSESTASSDRTSVMSNFSDSE